MRTVPLERVGREQSALPPRVQEELGELVGSAKEGLLALSVGVGLGVLAELLEEEVVEIVGPKGKHNPARTAMRHGQESGEMTQRSPRAGGAAAGADSGRLFGGAAADVRVLLRSGSALALGTGADARRVSTRAPNPPARVSPQKTSNLTAEELTGFRSAIAELRIDSA